AQPSLEPPYELVINGVVDSAVDDLLVQMQRIPGLAAIPTPANQLPGSAAGQRDAGSPRVVISIDSAVDKQGLRSVASEVVDSTLMEIARQKLSQFEIIGSSPALAGRAQYILGARLIPLDSTLSSRGTFRVDLLLTETKTSRIVAQVSVRFNAVGV